MLSRRSTLRLLALACAGGFTSPTWAATKRPFAQPEFEAALKSGKPVLIDVSASWCPVCKAQAPILQDLAGQTRFRDLVHLDIDFDTGKAALRSLGVAQQSTLIVFKDGKEVGRSIGDTNRASIEALLARAL